MYTKVAVRTACVFMCVCVKYLYLAQQIIVGNLFTLADTSTVYAVEE